MTLFQWTHPKAKKNCKTDLCTMSPDVIFGFPMWKGCYPHDALYSGRSWFDCKQTKSRLEADVMALRKWIHVITDHAIHTVLGSGD